MEKKDEELIEIADKNIKLMKETKELLENINKVNKILDKKKKGE